MYHNTKAQYEDFETWYNLTIKGEINKKWSYNLEPELRFFENASQLSNWQTEFSLSYDLPKKFDVGGIYRYAVNYEKPNYNRRIHRFAVFLKYQLKTGYFRWRYRGQLQNEWVNYNTSADGQINYMGHRHKFAIKYNDKDWPFEPSMGIEYYFSLMPAKDVGEWKQRYYITVEKKINKRTSAKLSYRRQNEFNVAKPDLVNILFVGIEYKPKFLKHKKKSKK